MGAAECKMVFYLHTKKRGESIPVAGCHVHTGAMQKSKGLVANVMRRGQEVWTGHIESLKVCGSLETQGDRISGSWPVVLHAAVLRPERRVCDGKLPAVVHPCGRAAHGCTTNV